MKSSFATVPCVRWRAVRFSQVYRTGQCRYHDAMSTGTPRVVIAGGGAAAFFAAIACKEMNQSARVTIVERGAALLSKVRISGGGRCNVTHDQPEPSLLVRGYPRGSRELRGPFTRFGPR